MIKTGENLVKKGKMEVGRQIFSAEIKLFSTSSYTEESKKCAVKLSGRV
jgi:hypothetical protein